MTIQSTLGNFVTFPGRDVMLEKLRSIEGYRQEYDRLFRLFADRLALKAYDRSAFVFILIELVYEQEESSGADMSNLLSRSVLALTSDVELAKSGLKAYAEIKATLDPESARGDGDTPEIDDSFQDEVFPAFSDPIDPLDSRTKRPHLEHLMAELQDTQKQVADLGLSARMSIDMTLSRPSREGVSHTWREISTLRSTLRGFDDALSQAQQLILEEIGVVDKEK